jgi:hypothetical protein
LGTKENPQLAAVECAREEFIDSVVRPARSVARGTARLRALMERWIVYVDAPLFPGGCFRAANLADFDSRPGPVRDAPVRDQADRLGLLAGELRVALDAREIADLDAELTAFQIDAVLCARHEHRATARRLRGRDQGPPRDRRLLQPPHTP